MAAFFKASITDAGLLYRSPVWITEGKHMPKKQEK
jgi:hypothetical protein